MIFASDLDRTIIYSDKFIKDFPGSVWVVERGKYNSYMTERAAKILKDISRMVIFVPCTTRTIEQYQRIQFFQQECIPKYAVVSNGGNLIIDGIINNDYRKDVKKKLYHGCLSYHDLLQEFYKLSPDKWANSLRNADGLFYYSIVDRSKIPVSELTCFADWALSNNWEISLQGRKLYLVPKVINKGVAIEKILELTGTNIIISAGDSFLDLPMLRRANYAICPAHGELYENRYSLKLDFNFLNTSGILASEKILEKVMSRVSLLSN